MADVTVSVQDADRDGLTPTFQTSVSTSDSYFVDNLPGLKIFIDNKGTSHAASSLTVKSRVTVADLTLPDRTITIADDTIVVVGDLPESVHGSTLQLDFGSDPTGLTFFAAV